MSPILSIDPAVSRRLEAPPLVTSYQAKLNYSGNPAPTLEATYNVRTSILQAVSKQSLFMVILRGVTLPENAMDVFDIMSVRSGRNILERWPSWLT
jgi:hypothetical protein